MKLDQNWLREYLRAQHIDLAESPVWTEGTELVGLALVGRRRGRAWLGAFGVTPKYRRMGKATLMMGSILENLRAQVEQIQLEVTCDNLAAQALYGKFNFQATRQLVILEGRADAPPWPLELSGTPCWQRETEALQEMTGIEGWNTPVLHRAGQIFRVEKGARWCDLRGSSALRLRLANEPVGSPLERQLSALGWRQVAQQTEMCLRFA